MNAVDAQAQLLAIYDENRERFKGPFGALAVSKNPELIDGSLFVVASTP